MNDQNTHKPMPLLPDLAELRYQIRSFLSFSETASEAAGIAAQHYQLMQVIEAVPTGQQPTISYLAERMILRHNSTVELVDRAERAGLVRRKNDNRDLRRSLVEMTPHGRSLLEKLVAQHVREIQVRADAIVTALHKVQQGADEVMQRTSGAEVAAGREGGQ